MPTPALCTASRRAILAAIATTLILVTLPQPLLAGQMSYATPPTMAQPAPQAMQTPVIPQAPIVAPAMTAEELGDLHMARRRYQAAIQAYRQLPHPSALVLNKIGMANQQMFVIDEARRNYEAALKIEPKNPDILNNIGTVYYSTKQYGEAERYYRKALKYHPQSALIYKNLGTALLAQDKFKKGWQSYQDALALDPEIFERPALYRVGEPTPTQQRGAMNYFLAKSYVRAGMMDRAVNYLRLAIDQGFTDRKKILADKEFYALRGVSAFDQLIAEQRM